jgi:hypothetical protein
MKARIAPIRSGTLVKVRGGWPGGLMMPKKMAVGAVVVRHHVQFHPWVSLGGLFQESEELAVAVDVAGALPRPHRGWPHPMDDALEACTQRLRHHIR